MFSNKYSKAVILLFYCLVCFSCVQSKKISITSGYILHFVSTGLTTASARGEFKNWFKTNTTKIPINDSTFQKLKIIMQDANFKRHYQTKEGQHNLLAVVSSDELECQILIRRESIVDLTNMRRYEIKSTEHQTFLENLLKSYQE
jgi:hypothetical protein